MNIKAYKYLFTALLIAVNLSFTNFSFAQGLNQQNAQNLNGGIIDGTLRLGDALLADTTGNDVTVKGITSINSLLSYVKSYFNDKIFIGYPASLSPVDYGAELQLHGSAKLLALADTSATGSRLLCVNNDGVIEACEEGVDLFQCGFPVHDTRDNAIYQTIEVDGKCWFKNDLVFSHITQTDLHPVFEINNEYNEASFTSSNTSPAGFSRLRSFCASKDAAHDTPNLHVYIEKDYTVYGPSVLRLNCGNTGIDYFALLKTDYKVYPKSSTTYTDPLCPSGWSLPSNLDYNQLTSPELLALDLHSNGGFHYNSTVESFGLLDYNYLTSTSASKINVVLGTPTSSTNSAANIAGAPVRCIKTSSATDYQWVASAWSACSGTTQTRTISCQFSDGTTVSNGLCSGAQPLTTNSCQPNGPIVISASSTSATGGNVMESFTESTPAGTTLTTVTTNTTDLSTPVTYSLSAAAAPYFSVHQFSGELNLVAPFDVEDTFLNPGNTTFAIAPYLTSIASQPTNHTGSTTLYYRIAVPVTATRQGSSVTQDIYVYVENDLDTFAASLDNSGPDFTLVSGTYEYDFQALVDDGVQIGSQDIFMTIDIDKEYVYKNNSGQMVPTGINSSGLNATSSPVNYSVSVSGDSANLFQYSGGTDWAKYISLQNGKTANDVLNAIESNAGTYLFSLNVSNGIQTVTLPIRLTGPYSPMTSIDMYISPLVIPEGVGEDFLVSDFSAIGGYMPYTYSFCSSNVNNQYFVVEPDEILSSSTPIVHDGSSPDQRVVCIRATDAAGETFDKNISITVIEEPDTYSWQSGSWGSCSSSTCSGTFTLPGRTIGLSGQPYPWRALSSDNNVFGNTVHGSDALQVPLSLGRSLLHQDNQQGFQTGDSGPAFGVMCRSSANNSQNSSCSWIHFSHCDFNGSYWLCQAETILSPAYQDGATQSCSGLSSTQCSSESTCTVVPGTTNRSVLCKNQDNVIVSNSNCNSGSKPTTTKSC